MLNSSTTFNRNKKVRSSLYHQVTSCISTLDLSRPDAVSVATRAGLHHRRAPTNPRSHPVPDDIFDDPIAAGILAPAKRSKMSSPTLPNIHDLGSLPDNRKAAALDLLFEPSPEIHSSLIPVAAAEPYSSYDDFIDGCRKTLVSLAAKSTAANPNQHLLGILGSHPRLGAKKVDSAQSAAEQARLGGESEALARLNREYEDKFPGLRYVVFVNGRGRPEIMEDMRARIDEGDFDKEVDTALHAMCDIAKDRASKLPVRAAGQQHE